MRFRFIEMTHAHDKNPGIDVHPHLATKKKVSWAHLAALKELEQTEPEGKFSSPL